LRVPVLHWLAILAAAAVGGAVNAVAGGGTLITFPTIVALGVPPLVANATSTVALWPGAVGGLWGYRGELAGARSWAVRFAVPSIIGGGAGASLLLVTSAGAFEQIVPFLVLGATVLFLARRHSVERRRKRSRVTAALKGPSRIARVGRPFRAAVGRPV
jgi:uncharacterized membrane protein YfcA